MERGTVKWFDEGKQYGFITPDIGKKDIFVHASKVVSLDRVLEVGDRVEFEMEEGPKGPQAKDVTLLTEEG